MTHNYFFGGGIISKEKWDRAFGRKKIESAVVLDMGEDYIVFEGPPYVVTGEAIEEFRMKSKGFGISLEEANKLVRGKKV